MGTSLFARVTRRAGAVMLVLLAAMPAGAMAATTVEVAGDTLTVQGGDEPNEITLTRSGSDFVVTAAAGGVTAGPGCSVAGNTATCAARPSIIAIDLLGGGGNDKLSVSPASESGADVSLDGEEGNDVLQGGVGDDEFVDSAGNDSYNGGAGGDIFVDGPGNDAYAGGTDDDPFQATDVVDFARGAAGVTVTIDGTANDGPPGEQGNNVGPDIEGIQGTPGNDTITGGPGVDDLEGGGGVDSVSGGPGNDFVAGGAGNDTLSGGPGDDELDDSEGDDDMSGGDGDDTAIIAHALALTISLDNQANDGAGGEAKNVRSDIENVTTGPGSDRITGSAAVNRIDGGAGDDTIDGLGGADTLKGGAGDDTIVATDGGVDVLLCGTESDTARGDAVDVFLECEAVTKAGEGTSGGAPEPGDTVKPKVTIGGVGKTVTRNAFRRGLRLKVTTNEPATVVAELLATLAPSGRIGFAAAVGDVAIGRGRLGLGGGTRALTVKPAKRFAKRVRNRRLRLTIRLTVTDRAGNVTVATKRVRVR